MNLRRHVVDCFRRLQRTDPSNTAAIIPKYESEHPTLSTTSERYFVTVDAETRLIRKGVREISRIRERIEKQFRVEIPIVWFVRFQRSWSEYVEKETADYFSNSLNEAFDGFELAKSSLRYRRDRGDEIGWHYHAYNYVHREDLSHETRIAILCSDLASCAQAIRQRHSEFAVRSMRFGWFFIPDYRVFAVLRASGIRIDASVRPGYEGKKVADSNATYLAPITVSPQRISGTWFVPYTRTFAIHDWEMVTHNLGWTKLGRGQADANRDEFAQAISRAARNIAESGGSFSTYERADAEANMVVDSQAGRFSYR